MHFGFFRVLSLLVFGIGMVLFVVVANTLAFQKRSSKERAKAQVMALVLVVIFISLGLFFLERAP